MAVRFHCSVYLDLHDSVGSSVDYMIVKFTLSSNTSRSAKTESSSLYPKRSDVSPAEISSQLASSYTFRGSTVKGYVHL
ncbi:hypothetical protein BO83DRAFT_375384 [Aspergillus eucalypticola CBS 122712]|uniref:Uncharacterized protein n=1 Tax=Aspergillus eucalypticola (strain CBS 122712 / IBT 29274) TaxID=1448314 RepID=A0A317W3I9_ASPEC|nr:uncharacterized protein BO83DRAFT_375384 [Aspergillus eucalypticola CBS 122712]PWY81176.1 hypothetical protein BO83DRAFT_375384 [Aspergillus eucalypticola CBS 122712]